jgi:hypothetical protein
MVAFKLALAQRLALKLAMDRGIPQPILDRHVGSFCFTKQ